MFSKWEEGIEEGGEKIGGTKTYTLSLSLIKGPGCSALEIKLLKTNAPELE